MSHENDITKLTNDNIGNRIYRIDNNDADGTYIYLGKSYYQCHLYARIFDKNNLELFMDHTNVFSVTFTTKDPSSRPVVDWSKLPVWFHFVAQDKNGRWKAFRSRPSQVEAGALGEWVSPDIAPFLPMEIPHIYAPPFSGCWYDSLVERPQS